MYLTYLEYKAMGGTLDETTFNDFNFEASSVIDWYTFGRLKDVSPVDETVKRCEYHIIKLLTQQESLNPSADASGSSTDGIEKAVASQSNDGVSISFNVLSAKDALENNKLKVEQTIQRELAYVVDSLGRKVLYRGLYPNE